MCHKVNRFNNIYILLCQKKVEQVRQLSNLLLRLDLQKCDKTSNYGSTLQQNTFASNTCSQEGRAQLPREGSRRSPWWRPQASSGWSPGWRSVAFAQQTQPPSSRSWLVALLSMFLGHGLVFVHISRYVQVASSSPLDAVRPSKQKVEKSAANALKSSPSIDACYNFKGHRTHAL